MLDLRQQRVVAAVHITREKVILLNRGIEWSEEQVRICLSSVMPADVPLVSGRQNPIVAEIVLREERVAVSDWSWKIILHTYQTNRSSSEREVGRGVERLNRVGVHRPICELMGIAGNGVDEVRTKSVQIGDKGRVGTPLEGDRLLNAVITDTEAPADDETVVKILAKQR